MADNQQLEFIIKAVDEASSALASVKASTDGLKKSVDQTNSSLEANANKTKGAKDAHESMATSVFKGVAAWDMLKQGIGLAGDFIKDSAGKYLEARQTLDLVRGTIESTGMSFDTAKPQLEAYADSMVRMGQDGEDAQLAAAKLAKVAGGDLPKGIQLAKLAADLATSGLGSMTDNADTLASVLAGKGTAAIKAYKLNLDSTATTAEILNAIQGKVTQTSEQYADTIPGKIGVVTQAFSELKQQVGEGLVTALYDAVTSSGDMESGLDAMKSAGKVLEVVVYELVMGFVAIVQGIQLVGAQIANAILQFQALGMAIKGDFAGAQELSKQGTLQQTEAFEKLMGTVNKMLNPMAALEQSTKKVEAAHVSAGHSALKAGDDIANAQRTASVATVSYATKVKQLSDAFANMLQSASSDLATMQDDFNKSMASISSSIEKTRQSIQDLNKEYSRGSADDVKSVAEKIVASELKVASLKEELLKDGTDEQKDQLNKQLAAEQRNLDSSKLFADQHQAEMTEARRRASETELQRDIEDFNTRRALALEEYNAKLADLNATLANEQASQAATISLYNQRTAQIKLMLDNAQKEYVRMSQERIAQTTAEVNASIALFTALAAAIAAVKSASASAVSTISVPVVSGKRAGGGSVMAGNSYIVGEKGAEMFTPDGSGTITPNNQLGGGNNITININGGNFDSARQAQKVGDTIVQQLRRRTRIGL